MPSLLQQMNYHNFFGPSDVGRHTIQTTAPDILQRHSINSLLSSNQDLITKDLLTPTEETGNMDILGWNQQSNSYNQNKFNGTQQQLTPPSPQLSTMSPGNLFPLTSPNSFDTFWHDANSIGQNTPLRQLQRTLSNDSSTSVSPITPTSSIYQRSFKGSPAHSSQPTGNVNPTDIQFDRIFPSRSNSPGSPGSESATSNIDSNWLELMQCYLTATGQQKLLLQRSLNGLSLNDLQTLNALRWLQQKNSLHSTSLSHLISGNSQIKPVLNNTNQWQTLYSSGGQQSMGISPSTDLQSRNRRTPPTYCQSGTSVAMTRTWCGTLPPKTTSYTSPGYSPKVFLGGIPHDITEIALLHTFKPYGNIRVDWPGREQNAPKPKGHIYVIFESEHQVRNLLASCTRRETQGNHETTYFFKMSSKRMKCKDVEIIPWNMADSSFVLSSHQKLDPSKTVFVGGLHGKTTAEGLATIMNDLFKGVVYAGIDTDKYKYPIGSARVTFRDNQSYMEAILAAFIDIKTSYEKKLQIDPYLEDALCSLCGVQHGPYYCRELTCFRYFCQSCWQWQHNMDPSFKLHTPNTRNSKSQQIIGVGPSVRPTTLTTPTTPIGINPLHNLPHGQQLNQQYSTAGTVIVPSSINVLN